MMTPQEIEEERKAIGKRLRELRIAKGMSMYKLSELTGVNQTIIKSVEEGESQYIIDTKIRMEHVLGKVR